jgi:hypothetical protein
LNRFYAGLVNFAQTCIGPILRVLQCGGNKKNKKNAKIEMEVNHILKTKSPNKEKRKVDITQTCHEIMRLYNFSYHAIGSNCACRIKQKD